jgi:general secretion pathway protein L
MGSQGILPSTTVIRVVQGRLAWYSPGSSDEPQWLDNDIARENLRAAISQQRLAPCFAAPGQDVRLLSLEVSAQEKKHIGKSLAFLLEEQVATDIEELHFASLSLDKSHLAVAICALERMRDWQDLLGDYPGIRQWIPEPLLLPWQPGEWCIVLDADAAIVRTGACEGFTIESEMLPVVLAAALEEQEQPQALICYGRDQAADMALLPESTQDRVQWRHGNLYSALMLSETSGSPLNLLQGKFARRLPLTRWWREWRAVAVAFGVAFALQLVATYADYLNLQRDNLALRAAVEQSYRKAYPKGAIVDAEKQLRRQLGALRGSGESSGFVSLMERAGEVIANSPGTSIATINYNDKGGEMRMNILAADFEAVERVREQINQAGLQAVMESSSAQGDQVRARLRVGEKS